MKVNTPNFGTVKVRITHMEPEEFFKKYPDSTLVYDDVQKVTVAEVDVGEDDNNIHVFEYAACSPLDIYSRHEGAKIALQRALEMTPLGKVDRTAVWKTMFARQPSPYQVLADLVKGKPNLVKNIILAIQNNAI